MNANRTQSKALIVVDVQNDFLPGGALAVPGGDAVIPVINDLIANGDYDFVVATQDWHPADHGSFATNHEGRAPGDRIEWNGFDQVLWPVHCVQGSTGAEFAPGLEVDAFDAVFRKGTDPEVDSYSGFFDNGHRRATGLGDWLREWKLTEVTVVGLATDYCVKFTALDAVNEGYETIVRADGCRGVNVSEGDADSALESLRECGVRVF